MSKRGIQPSRCGRSSSTYESTPTSYAPRAPPPDSTSARRTSAFGGSTGGITSSARSLTAAQTRDPRSNAQADAKRSSGGAPAAREHAASRRQAERGWFGPAGAGPNRAPLETESPDRILVLHEGRGIRSGHSHLTQATRPGTG